MGYFSNGTEGMRWQSKNCDLCAHYKDLNDGRGPGCPAWDAHLIYDYEQCKEDQKGKAIAEILGLLIPRSDDRLYNLQCALFAPASWAAIDKQTRCGHCAQPIPDSLCPGCNAAVSALTGGKEEDGDE